jgi:hypothetical protein
LHYTRFPAIEEVQQLDSQDFTVRDEITHDFLPVSNEICAIYIDDDVTKNLNEHTLIANRDFVVHPTKRLPGQKYFQDLHSTSRNRVPMILVLFFPFEDKMWGVVRKNVFNAIWYGGLLAQQLPWNFRNQSNSK